MRKVLLSLRTISLLFSQLSLLLFFMVYSPRAVFLALFCFVAMLPSALWGESRADAQTQQKRYSLDSLRNILAAMPQIQETERLRLLNALAEAYQYTSPDSSLLYATQALALSEKIGNVREKAWALYYSGYARYNQGKYDITLEILLEALPLFEQVKDNSGIGHTLNDIGNIQKRQGQFDKALDYYRRGLSSFELANDKQGIVLELCNIGATYRLADKQEEALRYSRHGLALADTIGYDYGRTFASANIGLILLKQGAYAEAEQYCLRALSIATAESNDKYISQMNYTLGIIAAKQNDFALALDYAERGKMLAQRGKFAERIKESYQAFVDIYTMQGNYQAALRYQQQFSAFHDSLFSAEVRGNITDLQTKIATEKKDKEIQLLQKDQAFAALLRNSLIAGLLLTVVLLGLAISRYAIKRKAAREYAQLNNSLAMANGQLGSANAQLGDANAEISRQLEIQAEQARQIEIANVTLQELNLQLERKNTDLVALNIEKNEFLGIAAHDLKNPLNGIRGLAELLMNYGKELPPEEHHKILGSIIGSSERMFELIKNLLDINTIEQGGLRLNPVVFDIAPLVASATDSYRVRSADKNITLHYTPQTDMIVQADEQAAAQVLDNLISNAVKYSPHGKSVYVEISKHEKPVLQEEFANDSATEILAQEDLKNLMFKTIRISVRDEGPGLSKQDMQKLFGKFARLSAQPTGGEHSTGLGLSIVKRMVEAMNGKVWCESELDKGATFIVELPAATNA
jgi:signal transduction histidine kinase